MCKRTKKRFIFNMDVLDIIKNETGYTIDYIRKSIRGDRVGTMPDKVIKRYNELNKIDTALKLEAKQHLAKTAKKLTP